MGKVGRSIKKGLRWTVGCYLGAFVAVNLHIGYDYLTSHRHRLESEEVAQYLEVRKYTVNIDGKEKRLTLVGERHYYNRKDNEIAQRLIDEHEHFADERGEKPLKSMSLGNIIFSTCFFAPTTLSTFYYNIGSGKTYDSISDIVSDKGYKLHALEDDPFKFLTAKEKFNLFKDSAISGLISPLFYYEGKESDTPQLDRNQRKDFPWENLIDKRDVVMADRIVELLNEEEVDNLLANFGKMHLEGIVSKLSEQIELQESDK